MAGLSEEAEEAFEDLQNVIPADVRALFGIVGTSLENGELAVAADIVNEANWVFRDFETLDVPASGAHRPIKAEIRNLFGVIDGYLAAVDPDRAWQAETETLVARFTTPPTWHRKAAIDDLVRDLKNANIWNKLDVLWVMAAADDQAARLNWKGTSFTLDPTGHAPTFTVDRGYTGDGATTYLNTGWIPSTHGVNFALNSSSAWLACVADLKADTWDMGDAGGAPHVRLRIRGNDNTFLASINDGSGTDTTPSFHSSGLFGVQRRGAADKRFWVNGINQYPRYVTASTSLPPTAQWICGANSTLFGTRQIGFAAYGASLEGLEEEFYAAVRNYFAAVGVTLDVNEGAYPEISGSAYPVVEDGKHNAFPGLARLPNGTLVALYRQSISHTGPGTIKQKLSTDEGQTWGAETTIVATTDARDPEVVLLANDNLLMSYCVTAPAGTTRTYVKHGTVSGDVITWGSPIELTNALFTGTVIALSSKPLELASGRILLPVWGYTGTNTVQTSAAVAISDDGGLTWPTFVMVAEGSDTGTVLNYNEANAVQFSDGEIFMMIRHAIPLLDFGGYVSSRSTDNGATWSAVDTEIRNVSNLTVPGRPALALYGNDRIFFMGRHSPYVPSDETQKVSTFYCASKDRGEGFTYPMPWGNWQYTYASIVVYSPTRVGAIISGEWFGQARADIHYQEFTVS